MARVIANRRVDAPTRDIVLLGSPIPITKAEVGAEETDYTGMSKNQLIEHLASQRKESRQSSFEEWKSINPRLNPMYPDKLDRIVSQTEYDIIPVSVTYRGEGSHDAQMCVHSTAYQYALLNAEEGFRIKSNNPPVSVIKGEVRPDKPYYGANGLVGVVTHLAPREVCEAAGINEFAEMDGETAQHLFVNYFADVMAEQARKLQKKHGVEVKGVLPSLFQHNITTHRPKKGDKVGIVLCIGEHMLPEAAYLATEDGRLIQTFPRVVAAASYLMGN